MRRQKELELEVLTGSIRGWEGDSDISSLGDIIHMGSVAVGPEHTDRYLVLFHHNLLILSVSTRMSAFIYEVSTFILTSNLVQRIVPRYIHQQVYW